MTMHFPLDTSGESDDKYVDDLVFNELIRLMSEPLLVEPTPIKRKRWRR